MGVLDFAMSHLQSTWSRRERAEDCSPPHRTLRSVLALPASLCAQLLRGRVGTSLAGWLAVAKVTCAYGRLQGCLPAPLPLALAMTAAIPADSLMGQHRSGFKANLFNPCTNPIIFTTLSGYR